MQRNVNGDSFRGINSDPDQGLNNGESCKYGSLASLTDSHSDPEEEDTSCGCSSCKSECLQVFNTPKWFLLWCCLFAFIQGLTQNGVHPVNASSYESRFNLDSSQVAWMYNAYDIVGGILVLPISYYGAHCHQPRLLSFMAFLMVVGNFIMAIPHFATGLYEYSSVQASQCNIANSSSCTGSSEEATGLEKYLYMFLLGQAIMGISGSTLYVTALVYIDSNVSPDSSPLYQAIMIIASLIGPVFGYIMGGQFLNYYVDFNKMDSTNLPINPEDPAWVGAWWVGWIIAGFLTIPLIPILLPYPKNLPGYQRLKRENEIHHNGDAALSQSEHFGRSTKDLPASTLILLKNPAYLFTALEMILEGLMGSGIANFLAKYIHSQLGETESFSGILAGAVIVPGAAVGTLVGGLFTNLFKLKVRGMLLFCVIASALAALTTSGFFIYCPERNIAGVDTSYVSWNESLSSVELVSSCNEDCGCNTQIYQPICGDNNKQYFNPCYGGCTSYSETLGKYTNCTCIPDTNQAFPAACDRGCTWQLGSFLLLMFITASLGYLTAIPSQMVTLRCVSFQQRSFALGIKSVVGRLIGAVPGPIIYGAILDGACEVWQDTCGSRGACWIYDHWTLAWMFAVITIALRALAAVLYLVALLLYVPPPGGEDDSDEDADSKQKIEFSDVDNYGENDNQAFHYD